MAKWKVFAAEYKRQLGGPRDRFVQPDVTLTSLRRRRYRVNHHLPTIIVTQQGIKAVRNRFSSTKGPDRSVRATVYEAPKTRMVYLFPYEPFTCHNFRCMKGLRAPEYGKTMSCDKCGTSYKNDL